MITKIILKKTVFSMCADQIWIARDYIKCSGCKKCEIACSLSHEGKIWPEASRIRVFMLTPTAEVPHFCTQCQDYPCVNSCKFDALSIDEKTGAVIVNKEKCTACGLCIKACPGKVPHIHPTENYAIICDLCGGKPQCAKVCQAGKWNALWVVKRSPSTSYKLYSRTPEEMTEELLQNMYGELGEELK
jgi:Fe-S-cluster-containing hydrogenase component 2